MSKKLIYSIAGVGSLIGAWYLIPSNSVLDSEFENVFGANKAYFTDKVDPEILNNTKQVKFESDGEAGKKAIERIDNHTFKILTSCDVGTGWVLDYIIPKDGTYPTTWFFATNAHVLKNFQFGSNPYNQELPISLEETEKLRKQNTKRNTKLFDKPACEESRRTGYSSFNLDYGDDGKTNLRDHDAISTSKMKEPELFYMPINFFDKSSSNWAPKDGKDYYKDFAVIKIEFEDAKYAEEATNNFYNKYKPSTTDGLDLSKDELMSRYDLNELALLNTNFYSLGYPDLEKQGQKFAKKSNWNESTGQASLISFGHEGITPRIGNAHGLPLKGHISANIREVQNSGSVLNWGGKNLYSFGYEYLIDNMPLGSGASGSLVTDKDGNVLGIYSNHYPRINQGVVVPLRSSGIDGDLQPQYDLIRGTKGQSSSYRQQFEAHFSGEDSFLKSKGWK